MWSGGDVGSAVGQLVVGVALAVVFHHLRDAHLLRADARSVFPPVLAVGYVVTVAGGWVLNVATLVQLHRGTVEFGTSSPASGGFILLVLSWFTLSVVVWKRLDRVDAELHGPVAGVGRFLRVGTGTAVPAAVRSLLRPSAD